jgi:hypothetical protein
MMTSIRKITIKTISDDDLAAAIAVAENVILHYSDSRERVRVEEYISEMTAERDRRSARRQVQP